MRSHPTGPIVGEKPTKKTSLSIPFIVSGCVHAAIMLLIGGAVLVPGFIPKAPFAGEMVTTSALEDPQDDLDPLVMDEPFPEAATDLDMPDLAAPAAPNEQTFDVIASAVPTSNFSLPIGSGIISPSATPNVGKGSGPGGVGGRAGSIMQRLFGSANALEGDLQGTFYDIKQTRSGGDSGDGNHDAYHRAVNQLGGKGSVRPQVFSGYFQAPDKLYASQFFFPLMSAGNGPKFFKVDHLVKPSFWIVHYTGQAKAPFDGRFRFVGRGGETLLVHWRGKLVLDASHSYMKRGSITSSSWQPRENVNQFRAFSAGRWADSETLVFGDWINATKDEIVPVDVIIGERGGGDFYCFLMWEGPGAEGQIDAKTGLMAFPIWTTDFGKAATPDYQPGGHGPPVLVR
jgi:hypothetical protein